MRRRPKDPTEQRSVWSGDGWVGEHDWLPAPRPKTPHWFVVVIAVAVTGSIVGGFLVLTGVIR